MHLLFLQFSKNVQLDQAIFNCFFQKFKAALLVELDKVFPHEINNYRAMRGDDKPS